MLEGRIYIETYENNDNFDVSDTYYADENAYIRALEAEYANNCMLFDGLVKNEVEVVKTHQNGLKKEYKNSYVSCSCVLDDETIDSFIYHNVNGDDFILKISLNLDENSEDFEYELKIWFNHHDKVFKLLSSASNYDIPINELPSKDLKFSFVNLSGGESYALLSGCTILDLKSNELKIRVSNLTFIKGL